MEPQISTSDVISSPSTKILWFSLSRNSPQTGLAHPSPSAIVDISTHPVAFRTENHLLTTCPHDLTRLVLFKFTATIKAKSIDDFQKLSVGKFVLGLKAVAFEAGSQVLISDIMGE